MESQKPQKYRLRDSERLYKRGGGENHGVGRLYSIRHSETKKNVRIIYIIYEGAVILLSGLL